ncbi:glycosyltransferase family 4 protein [Candidatus Woesebacteria bacterium]|nr:glycosyltransferase family 4 protein [Candidatus Woesebacteria bacterium]
MKAAIFNPYLDTLGGGERYSLAVAQALSINGYTVNFEWNDPSIKSKLENRFGLDLTQINFVDSVKRGDGYDVCFWVSDGSVPALLARKNILHFQVPFTNVGGRNLINKMKLFRVKRIVCNSNFTKSFIDKEYGVNSVVVYPPVDISKFKSKIKENIILFVGRFSTLKQAKRQDALINAFKKFYDSGFRDWKLVLAGGIEVGSSGYLETLERLKQGYPIKIVKSPKFSDLARLYGSSKIFWSASGYKIDEFKNPEKVEHFGITVIEAMAARCVPVIYKAGGHREIITGGENGFLWENTSDLISFTKQLANQTSLVKKLSEKARDEVQKYSYERFEKEIIGLF